MLHDCVVQHPTGNEYRNAYRPSLKVSVVSVKLSPNTDLVCKFS